jgi:hypothetical protein
VFDHFIGKLQHDTDVCGRYKDKKQVRQMET